MAGSSWITIDANAIPSGSIQQITVRSGLGVETTHAITPGSILLLPSAVAPSSDPQYEIISVVGTAHCGGSDQATANAAILEWFLGTWADVDYSGTSDVGDAAAQTAWSCDHNLGLPAHFFQIMPADVVGGVKGAAGQAIGEDAGTPGELLPAGKTIWLYMNAPYGRQHFLLLDVWRFGCSEANEGQGIFHPKWTNLHTETAPGSGKKTADAERTWDRLNRGAGFGSAYGVTKAGGLAGIKTKAVVEIRVNVKPATPVAA